MGRAAGECWLCVVAGAGKELERASGGPVRGGPVQDTAVVDAHGWNADDTLQRRVGGERGESANRSVSPDSASALGAARVLGRVLPGAPAFHGDGAAARL